MEYQFNDGGRSEAGFKGKARDCVTRAIAIATERPYKEVYDALNVLGQVERIGKNKKNKSTARSGVFKQTVSRYMESIGWAWTPTMKIGSGCKVHLRKGELPNGRLIAKVSKHMTAVLDGVIHDTHNPSREGTRCVYGYYSKSF